jgi:hypothetical protein
MGHTKTSGNGQGWRKVNGREMACKNQKYERERRTKIATLFTFLPPHIHIFNVIFQFRLGIFNLCVQICFKKCV